MDAPPRFLPPDFRAAQANGDTPGWRRPTHLPPTPYVTETPTLDTNQSPQAPGPEQAAAHDGAPVLSPQQLAQLRRLLGANEAMQDLKAKLANTSIGQRLEALGSDFKALQEEARTILAPFPEPIELDGFLVGLSPTTTTGWPPGEVEAKLRAWLTDEEAEEVMAAAFRVVVEPAELAHQVEQVARRRPLELGGLPEAIAACAVKSPGPGRWTLKKAPAPKAPKAAKPKKAVA